MRTEDFDYDLPSELIAQRPAEPRDSSRLLVLRKDGVTEHRRFHDAAEYLHPGDALVLNDTRVIAARLHGRFPDTGGSVEALLLRQLAPDTWEALVRPARRFRPGRTLELGGIACRVEERAQGGFAVLRFAEGADPTAAGEVPLPPYIHEQPADPERYQTVYARDPGSAAAPTAGLHFTPELLERLQRQGVEVLYLTLHVGTGTFRPVAVDDPADHPMHEEWYTLSAETAARLNAVRGAGGRIVATGTTVVRTLEHLAQQGGTMRFEAGTGWTRLLILPGFKFRAVDCLITNFHLPRSTLLMLVAAFAGRDRALAAYAEAIQKRYRFYSFGDAMFIERA